MNYQLKSCLSGRNAPLQADVQYQMRGSVTASGGIAGPSIFQLMSVFSHCQQQYRTKIFLIFLFFKENIDHSKKTLYKARTLEKKIFRTFKEFFFNKQNFEVITETWTTPV